MMQRHVIVRWELASMLRMTDQAISNHLHRKNWDAIPEPIRVGGRNKWFIEDVLLWLDAKRAKPEEKTKKRRGRRRKSRDD